MRRVDSLPCYEWLVHLKIILLSYFSLLTLCCLPGTTQDLFSPSMSVDVFAVESLSSRGALRHGSNVALAL